MKKYFSIITSTLIIIACTKEISIDLNSSNSQIIIEGNISDEPGPYRVKISKTVNFSDENNFPPVTGALVIISDNTGVVDTLTESKLGLYETHSIRGTQGNTYFLKVVADGKQYNANSTIPAKVNLDSIRFNADTRPGESEITFTVVPLYLDPVVLGNSYRFFFSSNGVEDKSYQVSNDNIGNGNVNAQPFFSGDLEIFKGDTVTVTMLCIDVNTYNYYYTLSQIGDGGPIGGAIPTNPPNNITGNKALGIFSAYTTQTKIAIAK